MKAKFRGLQAQVARVNRTRHLANEVAKAVSVPEPARISISTITRPENFRPIQNKTVRRLLVSIRAIGLQNPIAVRNKGNGTVMLVAGGHRLEAYKQLGLTHISARILDPVTSKIWSASENKDRAELTRLEQDRDIVAMAKALEQKELNARGGAQPHDKGNSRVARALNISAKEVRLAKRRIGISQKATILAEQNGLDNNAAALNKIAACPNAADQIKMAKAIINDQKLRKVGGPKQCIPSKSKSKKSNNFAQLNEAWLASNFRKRFMSADLSVRDRFLKKVLMKDS